MASVLDWIGVVLILGLHTATASLLTRLFRVRLSTRWGPIVYVVIVLPVVLVVSTIVLSGVFGLGTNLGGPGVALFVTIAVPIALGVTIDYLWMPAPEEVDLPETTL